MPGAMYQATLESIREWNDRTRSLFLRLPAETPLAFSAGQFISLELATGQAIPLVRAYSIASSPVRGDLLEICVDRVPGGEGSEYLCTRRPGARLVFKGPFGSFIVGVAPPAELVFVGDGTGVAPIRALVWHVLEQSDDASITVLHGARSPDELLYRSEFEEWMRRYPRVRWEPVMAPDGRASGDNPDLERLVAGRYVEGDTDRSRHFWICGVGDIVRRLRDLLRGAGYERKAVRYEQW